MTLQEFLERIVGHFVVCHEIESKIIVTVSTFNKKDPWLYVWDTSDPENIEEVKENKNGSRFSLAYRRAVRCQAT